MYFIPPGEPGRNGYVESFNSASTASGLAHARVVVADWKHDYNHPRRHSSLGYQPRVRFGMSASGGLVQGVAKLFGWDSMAAPQCVTSCGGLGFD